MSGFATTGRDELARLGFLKLAFLELGNRPVPAPGPPTPLRREIAFDVLYEFLKIPEEAGGVIETIPLDLDTTLSANDPRVLLRGPFLAASLNLFDVVDDPAATTTAPSAWSFDETEQAIRQTADIRGGTNAATPNKPGTYFLLRTTPVRRPVRDFSLAAEMMSSSQGGIGFVFRYPDTDNFHFALLDSRTGFRLIARKQAGTFEPLPDGGLDDTVGFSTGALTRVRLVAQDDQFRLVLDGETVLEAFVALARTQNTLADELRELGRTETDTGKLVTAVYDRAGAYVASRWGRVGAYVGRKVAESSIRAFLDQELASLPLDARVEVFPALDVASKTLATADVAVIRGLVGTRNDIAKEVDKKTRPTADLDGLFDRLRTLEVGVAALPSRAEQEGLRDELLAAVDTTRTELTAVMSGTRDELLAVMNTTRDELNTALARKLDSASFTTFSRDLDRRFLTLDDRINRLRPPG